MRPFRAEVALGIDVGGTAIKAGRIRSDGTIEEERNFEWDGVDPALDVIAELTRIADAMGAFQAVGLGVPGLLDTSRGVVTASPNLPALAEAPLRDALAAHTGLAPTHVVVENDANAAACGEAWLGAAAEERDTMLVTLGTGIGGGIILDGELYRGAGMAGEIGHVCIDPGGPPCGCGAKGCLETLASARAAASRAEALGLGSDLQAVSERARAGSAADAALLSAVGRDLGYGLAVVVTLLDLRHFVVGGGFSAAFDALEGGIREGLRERCYGERVEHVRLTRARLGNRAGWIGAAYRALCA